MPIRYLAWSPLLVLGVVLVFALSQALEHGSHLDERTARIIGVTLLGAFALYLFLGYVLLVKRKYLAMSVLTLWAFHVLAVSPMLEPSCSDVRRLDNLGERLGISLWESLGGIAVIALLTSVALVLRYRTVSTLPIAGQRTYLRWLLLGATAVATLLAAAAHWVAPRLHGALSSFGTDLPEPTLLLLQYSQSWSALPPACASALAYVLIKTEYTSPQLRFALSGSVCLAIILNVLAAVLLLSVFGSVLTMCGSI